MISVANSYYGVNATLFSETFPSTFPFIWKNFTLNNFLLQTYKHTSNVEVTEIYERNYVDLNIQYMPLGAYLLFLLRLPHSDGLKIEASLTIWKYQ